MTRQRLTFWQRLKNDAPVLLFLPVILPLVLIVIVLYLLYSIALCFLVWTLWLPRGKDVLLVYSDSPIWREYITTEVLPLVQQRAIVLNWSERKTWRKWSPGVRAFYHFGGTREFNPLVVVFRPARRARVFRFWRAFKDWKRGQTESVTQLRHQLIGTL